MKLSLYLVVKLLTQKLNVSNIITFEPGSKEAQEILFVTNASNIKHPTIIPDMAVLSFKYLTPLYQWSRFPSEHKPYFVQTDTREWNFIYCDYSHWQN